MLVKFEYHIRGFIDPRRADEIVFCGEADICEGHLENINKPYFSARIFTEMSMRTPSIAGREKFMVVNGVRVGGCSGSGPEPKYPAPIGELSIIRLDIGRVEVF